MGSFRTSACKVNSIISNRCLFNHEPYEKMISYHNMKSETYNCIRMQIFPPSQFMTTSVI